MTGYARWRPTLVTTSLCGTLVLALSACSSSGNSQGNTPSGGSSTSSGASGTRTLDLSGSALVQAAKAEGSVTFVTSLAGKDTPNYVHGFEKAYPGITVNVDRGSTDAIVPKAINAITAGKSPGDVFEMTTGGALELTSLKNGVSPYYDPNAADIPTADKVKAKDSAKDLLLVSDRVSYVGFGWNTKKIPASAVPHAFTDLLNPALQEQMGIEVDDTSHDWVGLVLHVMGAAKGKTFLKKLGSEAKIRQDAVSGAEMMSLIASGQFGASASVFQSHAQQQQAKGAPVKWKALNNIAIANVGEMGVFAKAKHPAAALLFIDFITSSAGRQVVKATHLTLPETKTPFKSWVPTSGYTAETYNTAEKGWANLQKADFGG